MKYSEYKEYVQNTFNSMIAPELERRGYQLKKKVYVRANGSVFQAVGLDKDLLRYVAFPYWANNKKRLSNSVDFDARYSLTARGGDMLFADYRIGLGPKQNAEEALIAIKTKYLDSLDKITDCASCIAYWDSINAMYAVNPSVILYECSKRGSLQYAKELIGRYREKRLKEERKLSAEEYEALQNGVYVVVDDFAGMDEIMNLVQQGHRPVSAKEMEFIKQKCEQREQRVNDRVEQSLNNVFGDVMKVIEAEHYDFSEIVAEHDRAAAEMREIFKKELGLEFED